MKKKWVRIFAGVIVTGAALWLSFRQVSWPDFWGIWREIQWGWVIAAAANIVLSVYVMGWRWKILLKPGASFSLRRLFRLNMVSQYWNILLPARAGDVVKAYLVSKKKTVPGGFAAGTVVLEKIFDFFVFCVFILSVPFFMAVEQEWWPGPKTALLVLIALFALLAFLLWKPEFIIKSAQVFTKLLPGRFQKSLGDFFSSGVRSFQILKNPRIIGGLVLFSFFFVGLQALSNFLVFWALGMKLSFWAALMVLLTLQVVSLPPSSPGKIGIFEYLVILALSVYGIEKTEALGYAVLLHLVVYLPKIVIGFFFIALRGGTSGDAIPASFRH